MLRIRVLGEFALELEGQAVEPPSSRRARSLLGLLALERRMHARSELAARFWPDVLDESARTSLRSALSAVRRALGSGADRHLQATREQVGLAEDVWTDAGEFEQLVEQGHLAEAIELVRGDLLTGLDDDWVLEARDEWRERIGAAVARLASEAEEGGDLSGAVAYTRRMVALDPLAEEGQRELIRRLAATGDRAAALSAYSRYSERLRTELRVAPSPATRELVDELRGESDEVEGPGTQRVQAAPAPRVQPEPDARPHATGTVTLLFTDLVGSTELLDELGDEEAERFRRIHFQLLRDVALDHAGHEVKNLGDGLMVAFGSSVDAVACAVGIQQAAERHNRREGNGRLRVRVGLNVGEPIRDEDDYFGASVVIAKRLCDRAEGSQILASDLVRGLVESRGSFSFRPVGELGLKGIPQPVMSFEIAWEPAEGLRLAMPAALRREPGPLIGRDAELGALGEAWRVAREGTPRVLAITGEPGIGKTRLIAEFCRHAHSEGATVLLGRSYEETLVPYQPFVESLGHYVSVCPADELQVQLGTRRGVLARLVPGLAASEEAPAGRGDDPEGERFALFDAVSSLLREAAQARSLVLALDDLHWADAPTLLLLRHMARSMEGAPLLILASYRDTEVREGDPLADALAELRRVRMLESLPLGGLDTDEVAALIRAGGGEVGGELARGVAERTEGNPYYVEEIVGHLKQGGELTVPESVKDLIVRRLRGLEESDRRTLAAAAVIGHEFEFELLERVAGTSGEELLDSLERALAERALVESPEAIGRYAFAHTLVRETVYEQLSATRRARLHLRVGEELAEQGCGERDEDSATLAHHFTLGGDDARSFEHQLRAARAATRIHALEAAHAHYDAAFEAAERLGLSGSTDERMRMLPLERGWLHHMSGNEEAAVEDYGAALEAARGAGDRRLEAEALDKLAFATKALDITEAIRYHEQALRIAGEREDTAAQVSILSHLSLEHSNQLDLERAVEVGERALELAHGTGEQIDRARALDALKLAALELGDFDRLRELTAELEEIERREGDLWHLQWTLMESAFVPLGRARGDEAAAKLDDALATSRRIGESVARPLIHDALGWLARSRGRYGAAIAKGRAAIDGSEREGGVSAWGVWTRATLGWTLTEIRAAADAVDILERGLTHAHWLTDRFRTAGHLASARASIGDLDGVAQAAAEAEAVLAESSAPPGGAFLFGFGAAVALARAHIATGSPERGEQLVAPFHAAAERSRWHEAVASADLVAGLSRIARGERHEARAPLARAAKLSGRHELPGVRWEALAQLAHLEDGEEAERLRAESRAIVGRLVGEIGDERLATGLRRAAGELTRARPSSPPR